MRAAIEQRQLAFGVIVLAIASGMGCFRGDSLVEPSGPASYRTPDPHISVIELAPGSISAAAGSKVQISAAPQNQTGQTVSAGAVAWISSNPGVATVSGSGMVTLVHPGSATITAIADGVTASVGAIIGAPPPASVSVTPASTLIQVGQQAQLAATALDSAGAADTGAVIAWSSSNSSVATVSGSGLVQAVAVGTVTITGSAGTATGTATVRVTSSTPVVTSVSVSPSSSSLYPGATTQLTGTARDSAGNAIGGVSVSWSTSNGGAATVSSSGLVTAQAVGSATITASASGHSGTASITVVPPVVASVSVTPTAATLAPGQTTQLSAKARDASGKVLSVGFTWSTDDASVATVSSSGLVTAVAMGSATITARSGAATGTSAMTVEPGPSGGFNEPSGMAVQVNTGPMSSIPGSFSIFSPSTPTAQGESSGNLGRVTDGGTGLRVTYRPALTGGYSPVRFGTSVPSAGTGWYYERMKVRFSANWTLNGNVGLKFCEPRTQQTGSGQDATENHVISMHDFETESTHAWLMVLLQGPNGQARDLFEQPQYSAAANLNNGAWHTIEVLFTPESSPGAGNGSYTGWVDGTQIAHYTNVRWLAAGNQIGWPYLMFDPTYGGGSHSPPSTMYWDFDQLYVSTK